MTNNSKFYKIKVINQLLEYNHQVRNKLLEELVTNATDTVIFKRRLRMLCHVNSYENQLLEKIQNFETNDIEDLNKFDIYNGIKNIVHRSA